MGTLKHWIWLTTRGTIPGMYAYALLEHFGSPEAAYYASEGDYRALRQVPEEVRSRLQDKSLDGAESILADCDLLQLRILTMQDTEYPQRLRQIDQPPCVLYVKGRLPQVDEEVTIGMVGARKATPYGIMAAGRLALDLARQGAVIVSGSARGIDTASLKGALQGGGKVISVLGNGIDVVYPRENAFLYADLAAAGALVSEYPPGTPPNGVHFPIRNRLIAGLSVGTVMVEGDEHSGALITARWALEQNRDVFAVPGSIDAPMSRGPNSLIRRGEARLICDAWDILEEYKDLYPAKLHPSRSLPPEVERARLEHLPKGESPQPPVQPKPPAQRVVDVRKDRTQWTDDQIDVLRALQGTVLTADDLVEKTGLPARRVSSALTMLQVGQAVQEESGKRFRTNAVLKE